jgi:hypothetical protein
VAADYPAAVDSGTFTESARVFEASDRLNKPARRDSVRLALVSLPENQDVATCRDFADLLGFADARHRETLHPERLEVRSDDVDSVTVGVRFNNGNYFLAGTQIFNDRMIVRERV